MGWNTNVVRHVVCWFTFVCLISVTQGAENNGIIPAGASEPEKTTYYNMWQQVPERIRQLEALQTNQTFREDVDHVMRSLNTLREIPELNRLKGTNFENLLRDDVSEAVRSIVNSGFLAGSSDQQVPSQCVNDTGRILTALTSGEGWAEQILDSIGKPGPSLTKGRMNFVGNYKQCRAVSAPPDPEAFSKGFKGAYTVVSLSLGGPLMKASWGLCFPDTCKQWQIWVLMNDTLAALNLTNKVSLSGVEIRTDKREITTATTLSIVILSIIGFFMIVGTIYDIIFIQRPLWAASRNQQADLLTNDNEKSRNGYRSIVESTEVSRGETIPLVGTPERKTEPGKLTKAVLAFSVYTNASKFLSTYQPPGSFGAIHGIRFLSMTWVILGHTYIFGMSGFLNPTVLFDFLSRWTFDVVANALVSVDTFFTLSGFLTAYLAVKEMKKKSWKINWGLFYFHRFWRLTPPYMLTLLLVLGLQRFFGSGALWSNVQPGDKTSCENSWWTHLLYVNNIVKSDETCFGHSWYLANDMQFFVVSPLMLIPFYFHTYAGLLSCLVFLLTTFITTGALSTVNHWPPTILSQDPNTNEHLMDYLKDYYFAPWCRIGPFVVGIATGYFLAIYRGRVPLTRVGLTSLWVQSLKLYCFLNVTLFIFLSRRYLFFPVVGYLCFLPWLLGFLLCLRMLLTILCVCSTL
ncbi:nose resistant to fluoxetine protein 6 [Aplysia californica]|uniref:Nose resistant to fluoxetine protein 6 n=1 Tax=Aplysia californica TaxID=6500 RepID=A0ABM1W153_APLCA|nr:nose resistant to fluoxetine protein 6 [Aplysia californica]